ncbi:AraC family transcriptional regulator [Actinobacteria bacterium YIM 96077]|uniref:AraC family transcriptional regulator n=1 Tax=Phytoactinopolyspora halophila TaxID=1981511 RepID=A0A329R1Y7_9ACTN|nr:helix-turn-helix domain-containing protein [Phytoactinopolyspora halophila]AYY12189.1 AraC family transcriptional regulator [Actinobacteria bacterium YIM 96077]RAW18577.1 AraC family transcriptional regulator [Phytoactinopolyspora halophila]
MLETEDRPSDSPYVARVWHSRNAGAEHMMSVATSIWELVVWKHRGLPHAAVRGPETTASMADVPDDLEAFGISFSAGTSMPHLPVSQLVDRQLDCPHVTAKAFVLRGEEWELPNFENAEDFVARLAREGVIVHDPLVEEVVEGGTATVSMRSVQRRVVTATGLTHSAIRQIERARQAAILLGEDMTPTDVAHRLGYYDQPHLARSLTRFIGRTATQLRRGDAAEPLSLLYKTDA